MTTEQPAITSASVILRYTDGRLHTFDLHEGSYITTSVGFDDEYPDWPDSGRRITNYRSTVEIKLTARSTGRTEKLVTWTRLRPDDGSRE